MNASAPNNVTCDDLELSVTDLLSPSFLCAKSWCKALRNQTRNSEESCCLFFVKGKSKPGSDSTNGSGSTHDDDDDDDDDDDVQRDLISF